MSRIVQFINSQIEKRRVAKRTRLPTKIVSEQYPLKLIEKRRVDESTLLFAKEVAEKCLSALIVSLHKFAIEYRNGCATASLSFYDDSVDKDTVTELVEDELTKVSPDILKFMSFRIESEGIRSNGLRSRAFTCYISDGHSEEPCYKLAKQLAARNEHSTRLNSGELHPATILAYVYQIVEKARVDKNTEDETILISFMANTPFWKSTFVCYLSGIVKNIHLYESDDRDFFYRPVADIIPGSKHVLVFINI